MSTKFHDPYVDAVTEFKDTDMNVPQAQLDLSLWRLANLTVKDKDLTTPPGSPADGDTYIPAATATGDWTSYEDDIAFYDSDNTEWKFATPEEGWCAYVQDENKEYRFNGSAWVLYSPPSHSHVEADITDKLHLIKAFFVDTPGNSELRVEVLVESILLLPDLPDSKAVAQTAATGQAIFTIKQDTTQIGTITFSGGADGIFSFAATVTLSIGDVLRIEAPASADASLADISITIKGTR